MSHTRSRHIKDARHYTAVSLAVAEGLEIILMKGESAGGEIPHSANRICRRLCAMALSGIARLREGANSEYPFTAELSSRSIALAAARRAGITEDDRALKFFLGELQGLLEKLEGRYALSLQERELAECGTRFFLQIKEEGEAAMGTHHLYDGDD